MSCHTKQVVPLSAAPEQISKYGPSLSCCDINYKNMWTQETDLDVVRNRI